MKTHSIFALFASYFFCQVLCSAQNGDLGLERLNSDFSQRGTADISEVNYSNGALSLSIQLTSVGDENYSYPIRLLYSSQGQFDYTEAGVVGLGWRIDYSPEITRSVLGYPDWGSEGGNNVLGYQLHDFEATSLSSNNWELILAGRGNRDYQPDVFHYKGLDDQTSFTIKRDEDVVQYPLINTSIDFTSSNDFLTRDINGNTFDFSPSKWVEQVNSSSRCNANPNLPLCSVSYESKWEPTTITNAKNETIIEYDYHSGRYNAHDDDNGRSISATYEWTHSNYVPPLTDNEAEYYINGLDGSHSFGTYNTAEKKLIERIDHSNGELIFNYNEYYTNSLEQPLLDDIMMYDKNDLFIGKIQFNYSPIEWVIDQGSQQMNELWSSPTIDSQFYRRLLSVEIFNSNYALVDSYSFRYDRDENIGDDEDFPDGIGITEEMNPFPATDETEYSQTLDALMFRKLIRVEYLSGSSQEFEYELDDFSFQEYVPTSEKLINPSLRVKDITINDGNGSSVITRHSYSDFTDNSASSGNLFVRHNFQTEIYEKLLNNWTAYPLFINYNKSISGQGFASLGPVTYTDIKKTQHFFDENSQEISGEEELGYEEVKLSSLGDFYYLPNDYPGSGHSPGFIPYWEIGKPLSNKMFDGSNRLVQETEHTYEYLWSDPWIPLIFDQQNGASIFLKGLYLSDDEFEVLSDYGVEHYSYYSAFFYLKSEEVKLYDQDESEVSSELTEYKYKYDQTIRLEEVLSTLSNGDQIKMEIKYVGDYQSTELPALDDQTLAIQKFQELELWNVPVEKQKFLIKGGSSEHLSSEIYFYRLFDGSQVLPVLTHSIGTELVMLGSEYDESSIQTNGTGSEFVYDIDFFLEEKNEVVEVNADYDPIVWQDEHGTSNSVFLDPDRQNIYASVHNGTLNQSRYTSFELDHYGGLPLENKTNNFHHEFYQIWGSPSYAATGDFYYILNGSTTESLESSRISTSDGESLPAGSYRLTYWKSGDVVVSSDGNLDTAKEDNTGEWIYVEQNFTCTGDCNIYFSTISGSYGFLDEIRIMPEEATITTSGYNAIGLQTFKSNESSSILNYEYDGKNRIKWVTDERNGVLKKLEYSEKDASDESSYNIQTTYTANEDNLSKSNFANLAQVNAGKVSKQTSFIDGWGRHRQTQTLNVNSTGDGVVSFSEYDDFGRKLKKYLPYVTSLGDSETYIGNAKSDQESYYLNTDDPNEITSVAFTETIVENSPFQRPLEQTGIGEDFQSGSGHTTNMEYGWNSLEEPILKWDFYSPNSAASASMIYNEGKLKRNVVINPSGASAVIFINALGQKIAEGTYVNMFEDGESRKVSGTIDSSTPTVELVLTYYVYDSFGRLVYIIPPNAIEAMRKFDEAQTLLPGHPDYEKPYEVLSWSNNHSNHHSELITFYDFDYKGRLKSKKQPEQRRIKYYYDQKDRLILEHLPRHAPDIYHFYKYDSQDRIVITGDIYIAYIDGLQSHIDELEMPLEETFDPSASATNFGYSNQSFPTITEDNIMQVFYFDNYEFSPSADYQFQAFEGVAENSLLTRGLATGSQTRVLPADGTTGQMLMTVSYYDEKRRSIQAITENHKGGFDRLSNLYNERGQIEKTIQHHKYQESSTPVEVITEFIYYSISGKLRTIKHLVDDDPSVYISNRGYDDLGKLKELNLHKRGSANYMQSLDYRYNEKGQLTHINNASLIIDAFNEEDDDVFGQELMYHQMSPEAELQVQSVNYPEPDFNADYNGNISGMIWNVKTPDEDGGNTKRHLYTYQYDDLGQLIQADYGRDDPSDPGQFNQDYGRFSANYNYDLGGNITRLQRRNQDKYSYLPNDGSGSNDPVASTDFMDDLTYTYRNGGFLLDRVDEGSNGMPAFSSLYSHFSDGAQQDEEYSYDEAGRNTVDLNKGIITEYNQINKPQEINLGDKNGIAVKYTYDAAGNKLAKKSGYSVCQPLCVETDYIGNFVYENGELKMIYHPEGVLRPTPEDSENETAYVYDYFIKDYLGNVRVVLTGENAIEEVKFLATMEEVHRLIESENFDNLDETAAALPSDYPVGGSVELNERIAYIIAEGEMTIGPSLVTPVRKGETVKASVEYFYEEDAPGATYDNLGFFVDEILVSLASSAAGVVPIGEAALNDIASGNTPLAGQLYQFLANNIDTTDMSHPHGYLVYVAYDNRNQMIPANSGALQVTDPNQLRTILTNDLIAKEEGFFHIYVSNGSSAKGINFDNFLVTLTKGKTRQINHYYPYGLPIAGIDGNHNDYLNKYTGKEHQTGEFMQFGAMNRGVEMFDFDARFFEPQLARWVVPDPAMQFSNPYLGMGNTPVNGTDPNGEWFGLDDGAAFLIGGTINLAVNAFQGNLGGQGLWTGIGNGIAAFGAGGAAGTLSLYGPAGWIAGGAILGGTNVWIQGAQPSGVLKGAAFGSVTSLAGGALGQAIGPVISSVTSSISSPVLRGIAAGGIGGTVTGGVLNGSVESLNGGSFWEGFGTGAWSGLLSGGIAGGASAGAQARSLGLNPFTGKVIPPKVMTTMQPRSFNSTYSKELALPSKLSHYTPDDPHGWTSIGRITDPPDKLYYYSTNPEFSRVRARSELALPKTPNFRIDINTNAPNFDVSKIVLIRQANGNFYKQGGGGWEVIYKGRLDFDPSQIDITPLRP